MGPQSSTQLHTINSYRVMQVQSNSPASNAGLQPMLDFIIVDNLNTLESTLQSSINKETTLITYNMHTRSIRNVKITPTLTWGGNGMLGALVNKEDHTYAHEKVFQILNIYVDSPLHKAGLKSVDDYILGTSDCIFDNLTKFQEYLKINEDKEIELMVFSKSTEKITSIKVIPTLKWNKSTESLGLLGSILGSGTEFPMKEQYQKEISEIALDRSEESKMTVSNSTPLQTHSEEKEIGVSEDDIAITAKKE